MNFLAHLYLAEATPASWIGNLMPDMVRGRLPADLPAPIRAGVHRHRRVDAFTDTHPIVSRSKALLRERHGLFAGILVDIFYDHFLARRWRRHHGRPLPDFVATVYDGFASHAHLMPQRMRYIISRMREQDWLCDYAERDGIELTLTRMSRRIAQRLRRPVQLELAMADLREHEQALGDDFAAFFPELVTWVHADADQPLCPAGDRPAPSARMLEPNTP